MITFYKKVKDKVEKIKQEINIKDHNQVINKSLGLTII